MGTLNMDELNLTEHQKELFKNIAVQETAKDILAASAVSRIENEENALAVLQSFTDDPNVGEILSKFKSNSLPEPERLSFRNVLANFETERRALEQLKLASR